MASKFPEERQVQMRARKGHDMTWSCDIHGEPISFHCKEHNISVCDRCAIKEHCQKPCQLDDIGDVISEMGRKLEDKLLEIEETKKRLKKLDSQMQSFATVVSNHFESVTEKVNTEYEVKMNSVKDKERDEIRVINEDADEKIRIINEKRDIRITACSLEACLEAGRQQRIIKEPLAKLLSDIKTINGEVVKKVEDLQSKNKYEVGILDNMICKIKRIKQDDKELVNEAPQIIASLDESLSDEVHQDKVDYMDQIQREVLQRVKVVESKVGGEHYTRIASKIEKWELVKSIDTTTGMTGNPHVYGLISNDEIMIQSDTNDVYVTKVSSERTEKVIIEGGRNICFASIAPTIDNNLVVCGKRTYDTHGITIYDRQWKVVRDITICPLKRPKYCSYGPYVDVCRNGMILAAFGQSKIDVINPADGKIVNTITMQGKSVSGGIQALSSGDIVVKTGGKEFTVISRSGEEKAAIHCDEWCAPQCGVDKLTDTLYITYWDAQRGIITVDQVSCDGTIEAKRIVTYVTSSERSFYNKSPCFITPTGNLIACNGEKFFMYKKILIFTV